MFLRFKKSTALLLVYFWTQIISAENLIDRVVVTVNGAAITEKEISGRLALRQHASKEQPSSRAKVVEQLIMEELMLQIAQKNGLHADSKEVNQMVSYLVQSRQVPPEFANNTPQLKRQVMLDLIMQSLGQDAMNQVSATTNEVDMTEDVENSIKELRLPPFRFDYERLVISVPKTSQTLGFNARLKNFLSWIGVRRTQKQSYVPSEVMKGTQQYAESILLKAKEGTALSILSKKAPKSFSCKTERFSKPVDQLPKAYVEALTRLKPGEVVGPLSIGNAFHIIKLHAASGPTALKASHILLSSKEGPSEDIKQRLQQIRASCLAGDLSFEAAAQQYSEDPYTVFEGGDLGWVLGGEGALVEQLKRLQPGEISPPFKTQRGWHIVKLVKKEPLTPAHPAFKQQAVKESVRQRSLLNVVDTFQKQLYAAAHIEWIDPELKSSIKN